MPTYPKRHTYPGIHLLTRGMLEVKIPVYARSVPSLAGGRRMLL